MLKRIVLLLMAISLPGKAEQPAPDAYPALSNYIESSRDIVGLPFGTAVVMIKDGQVVYSKGFGYADIEKRRPVNEETAFYIASTTKPFYALSLLLAEAEGQFDSQATLADMFPALPLDDEIKKRVTAAQLLTHTSGLSNDPLTTALAYSGLHTPATEPAMLGAPYTTFKEQQDFDYSNFGYKLLGIWQQQTRHIGWQQSIENRIINPLGLTHTSPYVSTATERHWPTAEPYSLMADDPARPLSIRKHDETMHAAGGLLASAGDLASFLRVLMEHGKLDGRPTLAKNAVEKALTKQVETRSRFENLSRDGYAYGWYTGEFKGQRMLHHLGSYAGTHAHMSFMPELKAGLIVLNNEDMASIKVTAHIAELAYSALLGEDIRELSREKATELGGQIAGLKKGIAGHKAKLAARPLQLSLEKSAYAGDYSHPLFGRLQITGDQENALMLHWGQVHSRLSGYTSENMVRYAYSPRSGAVARFNIDKGSVQGVTLEGIEFQKQTATGQSQGQH